MRHRPGDPTRGVRPAIPGLIAGALLFAGGCGFHLRGSVDTAADTALTFVDGDLRSPVAVELRRNLVAASRNAPVAQESALVLRVLEEDTGRRVASVGGDGKVDEYEVFYAVVFQFAYPPGNDTPAEPAQTLRVTRTLQYDAEGVLGSSDEESTLRAEMRRDLVRLILLRLRAHDGAPGAG